MISWYCKCSLILFSVVVQSGFYNTCNHSLYCSPDSVATCVKGMIMDGIYNYSVSGSARLFISNAKGRALSDRIYEQNIPGIWEIWSRYVGVKRWLCTSLWYHPTSGVSWKKFLPRQSLYLGLYIDLAN